MTRGSWTTVGASVAGFSHESAGTGCQDAFEVATLGEWVVAAVSDGAGSAPLSGEGAKTLTRAVVLAIQEYLKQTGATQPECTAFGAVLSSVIETVRSELPARSGAPEGNLKDYSATLVGFAATPDAGIFFHIGDGAAVAVRNQEWTFCFVSKPENGEYANETYFFTADNWRDHLRLAVFDRAYDVIVAMSDGCMPFAMSQRNEGLYPPFIGPATKYFLEAAAEEAQQALEATLRSPDLRKITGDDKTLVWAAWKPNGNAS